MMEHEQLVEQVLRLRLRDDDVIVFQVSGAVDLIKMDRLCGYVKKAILPRQNQIIVLQRDMDFSTISLSGVQALGLLALGALGRLQAAERTLIAGGYSYLDGAEMWKPPLGPSARPLLERIAALESQRDALLESLTDMVAMMDSGDEHGAGSEWYQKAVAAIKLTELSGSE